MVIINNCTNIFSQSCNIYILLVEQVTTDYDGSSCFALGFSFVFPLHSNMLKYCFTWRPSIPFTFCSLIMHMNFWVRLADIELRNTSMKSNYFVISATLVVEKHFYLSLYGSEYCLYLVTQYTVALATFMGRGAVFIGGEVISGLVLMVHPGTFELMAI